jgi:hypothetical protein
MMAQFSGQRASFSKTGCGFEPRAAASYRRHPTRLLATTMSSYCTEPVAPAVVM